MLCVFVCFVFFAPFFAPFFAYVHTYCIVLCIYLWHVTNKVSIYKLTQSCSINKSVSAIIDVLNAKCQKDFDLSSGSTCVSNALESLYHTHFFSVLENDRRSDPNQKNKLRTYRTFKTGYQFEPYLDALKNRGVFSKMAKFRLSNHNLLIEKGRHAGTQLEKRLCPFGCDVVEDEFHFFARCPSIQNLREEYFTNTILIFVKTVTCFPIWILFLHWAVLITTSLSRLLFLSPGLFA